jgi:hypothetical protein
VGDSLVISAGSEVGEQAESGMTVSVAASNKSKILAKISFINIHFLTFLIIRK